MLIDAVTTFLADSGWKYEGEAEGAPLRAFHDGDTGTFPVYVRTDEERQQVVVHAVLPDLIPEDARLDVAALLAGLNYGLSIASFEIDLHDGEVRCRAGVDVDGGELTPGMVHSIAAACVLNMDTYRPAIESVAAGSQSVLAALDDVGG